MPVDRLWTFLSNLKSNDENGNIAIPDDRPSNDEIKAIAKEALGGNKGAGWSARLFEECELHELPVTVVDFLASVFVLFPPLATIDDSGEPAAVAGDSLAT